MIKSVKTMVRVREVEIEKYRNKLQHEETERIHKLSQKKETESETPPQRRY